MAAKKTNKTASTDLDFDLNLPDMDFDMQEPKDDRHPVTKVLDGVKTGFKDSFKDPGIIRRVVDRALPDGYSSTLKAYDNTTDLGKQLYDTAAKEVKPAVKEFTKAVDKIIPESSKRTKAILEKLNKWVDSDNRGSSVDVGKSREEYEIANQLGSIFGKQAELQVKQQEDNENSNRIRDGISAIRHKDSISNLMRISEGINTLVQYQDKIASAYQKKSLELQYRSYFVLAESLQEAKKSNAQIQSELAAITKNSALPDYVKMQDKEVMAQYAKNKFFTSMTDMFLDSDGIVKKLKDGMVKTVKQYSESFSDALNTGTMVTDTASSMSDIPGMGDAKENMGSVAGGMAAEFLQNNIFGEMKGKLSKNDKLRKFGKKAKYLSQNYPQMLNDWSEKNSGNGGIKGFLAEFLGDSFRAIKPESGLQQTNLKDLNTVAVYTNQANKSITEIIPGYLSRIFRELQVIRTGDDSIKLTGYNFMNNKFDSTAKIKESIKGALIRDSSVEYTQRNMDSIFNEIDPDGKLDPTQRKLLSQQFLSDRMQNKAGDPTRYLSEKNYNGTELEKYKDNIIGVFKNYIGDKDTEKYLDKQDSFNQKFMNLGRGVEDSRSNIQTLVNSGFGDYLETIGLVKSNNGEKSINFDRLLQMYTDKDFDIHQDTNDEKVIESLKSKKSKTNKSSFINTNKNVTNNVTNLDVSKLESNINNLLNSIDGFKTSYEKGNSEIISLLQPKESKEPTVQDRINETLLRIENIVKAGFTTTVAASESSDDSNPGKKTYTSFLHHLFDKGVGIGKFGFKAIGKINKTNNFIATSAFKGVWGGLKGTYGFSKGIAESFWDVYLPGEKEPRLIRSKMKAGDYFDQNTGKVLKNLKDITGTVVDAGGNVIVSKDEIKDLYIKSTVTDKIIKVSTMLGSGVLKSISSINSLGVMTTRFSFGILKGAAGFVKNLIDGPGDVYVKGDTEPALLGRIMSAGGYFSKSSGKSISRMSDIDGPVVDKEGNVLLSLEQLKKGILDKNGQPIRSFAMKVGMGLANLGVKAFNAAKGIAKGVYTGVSRVMNASAEFAIGGLERIAGAAGGNFVAMTKKSANTLERIYTLLDQRLPKSNKIFGDTDGDGFREGSWQDKKSEKTTDGKTKDTKAKESTDPKEKRKNTFDLIQEKLSAAKDAAWNIAEKAAELFGGAKGASNLAGGLGATTGTTVAAGANAAAGGVAGAAAKGGLLSRAGSLVMRAGGMIGRGALGLIGLGGSGLASAAMTGASALGSAAVTGAGIAGQLLLGLGSLISSPVVLGTLATAAVAYGGYKLYKSLTTVTDDPLVVYRLAQYGFTSKDQDIARAILSFESMLEKNVVFEEGKATLNEKGLDYSKIFGLFGFDSQNENAINNWAEWFQNRFKPVFLTHQTALNIVGNNTTLSTASKLPIKDKLKYFNLTPVNASVYDNYISPFPSIKKLVVGKPLIYKAYESIKSKMEEEAKKSEDKEKTLGEEKKDGADPSNTTKSKMDSDGKVISSQVNKTFMESVQDKLSSLTTKITDGIKNSTVGKALTFYGNKVMNYFGFNVSALEAIRFRAYGLKDMDRYKVMNLRELESIVSSGFLLNADRVPEWRGDQENITDKAASIFGISKTDKNSLQTWVNWFMNRFMPVYTAYRGELTALTGKLVQDVAEKALKSEQMVSIGEKLIGTNVWNITYSPWLAYSLNTDASGTQDNLNALKSQAKESTLQEQKANTTKTDTSVTSPIKKIESSTVGKVTFDQNANEEGAPDSESSDFGKRFGGSKNTDSSPGTIAKAGGPVRDGSAGMKALILRDNATLDGIHPDLKRLFLGMAQEYNELTGKIVGVNAGFRSHKDQEALWNKDPKKAARPGTSMHESGLAIDIDPATLNEMDQLGLMRKYGFTRPVGNEPWHMEPSGIQSFLSDAKANPISDKVTQAIAGSMGRGGGGWGTMKNVGGYGRNNDMALAIYSGGANETEVKAPVATLSLNSGTGTDTTANAPTAAPGGSGGSSGSRLFGNDKTSGSSQPATSFVDTSTKPASDEKPSGSGGTAASTFKDPGKFENTNGYSTPTTGQTPGSNGLYGKLPVASGGSGWNTFKDMIISAAKAVGVDVKQLTSMVAMESGFNANAKGTTSASGLLQFVKGTWNEMISKYADKFGIPKDASPFDPKANLLLGAQYIKDNLSALKTNGQPTGTDLYLAHLLGPNGANKLLSADPNSAAAMAVPNAAKSNPDIFFYSNGQPRTVREVYALLQGKLSNKLSEHGVDTAFFETAKPLQQAAVSSNVNTSSAPSSSQSAVVPVVYNPAQSAPKKVPDVAVATSSSSAITSVAAPTYTESRTPQVSQPTQFNNNELSGSISSTLVESLSVQKQILNILTQFSNRLNGVAQPAPTEMGPPTQSQNAMQNKRVTFAPTAPVPMNSYGSV